MNNINISVNEKAFRLMEEYVMYNSSLSPFLNVKYGSTPSAEKKEAYQSLIVTTFIKKMVYDITDVDYDELDF